MKTRGNVKVNFGVAGLVCSLVFASAAGRVLAQQADGDQQVQAAVQKSLDNKKFKDVSASARNGAVTLTGTVDVYAAKEDADKRAHHTKGVKEVDNEIQVSGQPVDDATLRTKLSEKLAYDRVGYGTTAFNDINLGVQNGVVTLSGTVYGPSDKDSALSVVANYPGVKDVVDNLEVAPLSPMDDQIRIAEARAIYGAPQLNRYALDPARPIRITVVNGNVTLSGVVDSKADKDVANIRANGVAGVFKVTNNLQVAGSRAGQ